MLSLCGSSRPIRLRQLLHHITFRNMCHIIFFYSKRGSLPLFLVSLDSSEELCKYFVILNFLNHANVTETPVFGCKVRTKTPTDRSVFPGSLLSILRVLFVKLIIKFLFRFSLFFAILLFPCQFLLSLHKPFLLSASQEYQLGWLSSHAFFWFVLWGDIWEVVGFHEETHIQVGWEHMAHPCGPVDGLASARGSSAAGGSSAGGSSAGSGPSGSSEVDGPVDAGCSSVRIQEQYRCSLLFLLP